MLEVVGLRRRFGDVVALDGLSFSVPAGCLFGVLGPNGSGKTTTLRAILGLVEPDAGHVYWHHQPVDRALRATFGYLPETRGLYPSMSVLDHLVFLGRLRGASAAKATASAMHWLERLDVAHRAADPIAALSLGTQQRVQLAAALLGEPQLLVLDEPFAALDPGAVDVVGELLHDLARRGVTVVFSSHQLDLVEHLCEKVVIIDHGRQVVSGDVDSLTTGSERRLLVSVAGRPDGAWASRLPGVTLSERGRGRVRLVLAPGVDPQAVLRAASQVGPVEHFSFERRRLSEVFREALAR